MIELLESFIRNLLCVLVVVLGATLVFGAFVAPILIALYYFNNGNTVAGTAALLGWVFGIAAIKTGMDLL